MLENILAKLFPPSVGEIRDWEYMEEGFDEQGECGVARPKKYRDAVERVQSEGI